MVSPNGNGGTSVSNAVLGAKLDFMADEFRELRRAVVPRGEYEIARAADLARLSVVEATLRQQGDRRWQVIALTIGAVLSAVGSISAAVFVAVSIGH